MLETKATSQRPTTSCSSVKTRNSRSSSMGLRSPQNEQIRGPVSDTQQTDGRLDAFPALQRNLGNSYIQSLMADQHSSARASTPNSVPSLQRKCSCGGACARCQDHSDLRPAPAVPISQPGDPFEQQADQLADQILAQLETRGTDSSHGNSKAVSDAIGMFEEGAIVDAPMALSSTTAGPAVPRAESSLRSIPRAESSLANGLTARYGPGQALGSHLRSTIEPLLGYNLSSVRVYPQAVGQLAADVNARAFTLGRNIYFGEGQYRPDSRDGMRVLLHELVHTTQPNSAGEMIQRTPSISTWAFHTSGTAAADNCCTACPGAKLGVNTTFYGASSFTNGMELQAFINNDETGASYDIKRVKERSVWQKIGGTWNNIAHVGPGADDDSPPNSLDECLTPITKIPYLPYIYSLDEPGFSDASIFDASATEAVYKATFTESVQITPASGSGFRDTKTFDWHSVMWLTKASGSWAVDTTKSEIKPGAVTVGTTAP